MLCFEIKLKIYPYDFMTWTFVRSWFGSTHLMEQWLYGHYILFHSSSDSMLWFLLLNHFYFLACCITIFCLIHSLPFPVLLFFCNHDNLSFGVCAWNVILPGCHFHLGFLNGLQFYQLIEKMSIRFWIWKDSSCSM